MANVSSQQKKIIDLGVSVARAISGELSLNYRGERSIEAIALLLSVCTY